MAKLSSNTLRFGLLVVVFVVCVSSSSVSDQQQWKLYKSRHGKHYMDPNEDDMRMATFLKNKRSIEQHNAEFGTKWSYKRGLNQFSDWTSDEMATLRGARLKGRDQLGEMAKLDSISQLATRLNISITDEPIPAEVDWRKSGRVSEVKMAGNCAAHWAFATAGVLEGQQANLNISKLIPLSAQNVLDCSGYGCQGGSVLDGLQGVANEHGIMDEQSYPYTGTSSQCRFNKDKALMPSVTGFTLLDQDEDLIKMVVAKVGPVAVSIDGFNIADYQSGIYADNPFCLQDPFYTNYWVLIVGYGRDKKRGDYWIIKTSFGKDWGEQGYLRLIMHRNMCGIAFAATIPTFKL